ncbi:hypothetical protein HDU77_003800 [Chytriomyces hyalinus]|nr:hypothetical protein HDU77_003800 [Chytriomyces hyalinus]
MSQDPISSLFVVGRSETRPGTGPAGTPTAPVYYLPHPCHCASKRTAAVSPPGPLSGDDDVLVPEVGKRIGELSIDELERIMVLRHERRKKRMQDIYDEAIESWKRDSAKWPRLA